MFDICFQFKKIGGQYTYFKNRDRYAYFFAEIGVLSPNFRGWFNLDNFFKKTVRHINIFKIFKPEIKGSGHEQNRTGA